MTGIAPLPAVLTVGALTTLAFASSDPLVLGAVLAVSGALLAVSPGPRRLFAMIALTTGAMVALLNPFVGAQGDLILIDGPSWFLLDLQVTLEELLYGLAAGARLAAVTMLCGAFLGLVDRDRLAAGVSRFAPRSALTVALAARLLPALRRDATAIGEAARLRGMAVTGHDRAVLRSWAGLLEPLCAAGLERGLDHAEAMAARGYGSGPRTAMDERPLDRTEQALTLVGALLSTLAVWSIATGAARFTWYPTLGHTSATAVAVAAGTLVLGLAGAALARRGS
jgi:energy-coupling factor transport system permease protein